jgi:Phosphate-induced protein 1 conserved region
VINRIWRAALVCAAMLIFVVSLSAQSVRTDNSGDLRPNGKGWGERDPNANPNGEASRARTKTNGISYHGGPVMTATKNVYFIWYGTWSSGDQSILTNLVHTEGGSPYFNINTTYTNSGGTKVSNSISYNGSTANNYVQGKSLSDASIQTIVSNAISSGALPKDTNGVYFVLTASDVNETSGFCTQYCGWHTHGTISGSDIKYAFIGNPARCPSACEAQSTSPNGSAGADGAASIIAHELEEASTDPDLNAWYDSRGEENADKCAWTFGTESTASNGSKYNVTFGSRQYLIQQNWVNASGGYCSMSY